MTESHSQDDPTASQYTGVAADQDASTSEAASAADQAVEAMSTGWYQIKAIYQLSAYQ